MTYAVSDQRARNFHAGVAAFAEWLADRLRLGLAAVETDPATVLGEAAERLTDAQLPAPASALRSWQRRVGTEANWASDFLAELGYWHVLCARASVLEQLPPEHRDGVLGAFGIKIRRADVESAPLSLRQRWTCVGIEAAETANVFSRRTYWRGSSAEAWAVQLDFNYGSAVPPSHVEVGTSGTFGVHAYPGGLPGRIAAPTKYTPSRATEPPHRAATWAAQHAAHVSLLARQPWRREFPIAVGPLRIHRDGDHLYLTDAPGAAVPLVAAREHRAAWNALAVGAGEPVTAYGVIRSGEVFLHAVWASGRLYGVA